MDALKPPPGLGAAILLFWGWHAGFLPFALPMALIFEGPRWVRWRWALSDRDLTRIVDLQILLFVGVGADRFLEQGAQAIFVLVRGSPLIVFLLVGLLRYSQVGTIAYRSLFLSLRRSRRPLAHQRIDLSFPYLLLCLVAAAMTPGPGFFWGVLILSVWALWTLRPQRYSLPRWLLALSLGIGAAVLMQTGIRQGQLALERWVMDWVADRYNLRSPSEQSTLIGQIGELKLSDRILLRVRLPRTFTDTGFLLRQTSYDRYFEGRWRTTESGFQKLFPIEDTFDWPLAPGEPRGPSVEVAMPLPRGRGLLPLPGQTQRIDHLLAAEVDRSPWGVVRVREGAKYVFYRARLGSQTPRDAPPRPTDRHLPDQERALLKRLVSEHRFAQGDPRVRIQRIRRFFQEGFRYSLVLNPTRWPSRTALDWFLTESRAGHCEYYATATVLLLRAAGIPARYATGFLVTEYSPWEDAYLVRRSHAHSWALAYVAGKWVPVDTTPSIWVEEERRDRSLWQPVSDLFSWVLDRWRRWQWRQEEEGGSNDWLAWLLIPLFAALFWRLARRKRVRHRRRDDRPRHEGPTGPDSPFFRILERLARMGYERKPGESLGLWLRRISPPDPQALEPLLRLHQRLRFDPRGLGPEQRRDLEQGVDRWLQKVSGEARS